MIFRKACSEDVERCWEIVSRAKRRMTEEHRDQWQGEYPDLKNIENDAAAGIGYVLCDGGRPMAYGAVITTGEPAYEDIDGKWLSENEQYVVLHRLCVAQEALGRGLAKQFFQEVEMWAKGKGIKYFRVDTNYDNAEMLHILPSLGFEYCGEVIYESGSRKAFEKEVR